MHDENLDHSDLESQLRDALRRPVETPAGLEERILAHVLHPNAAPHDARPRGGMRQAVQHSSPFGLPRWAPLAAVLTLAVLLGFAEGYHQGRAAHQRNALQAAQEFAMAMHVTDNTLAHVAAHLNGQLERVATETQQQQGESK